MVPLLVAEESEARGWVWLQMGPVGVGAPSGPSPAGCWVAANENLACLLHLLVSPPLSEAPLTYNNSCSGLESAFRWQVKGSRDCVSLGRVGPQTIHGSLVAPCGGIRYRAWWEWGVWQPQSFVCPQVGHTNSYKNEYVCVHARTHTHTSSIVCLWSESWASVLSLFFLPSILGQSMFLQTDKALFKVQCTLLLLHCHQKPLTKCLISLWGYLYLVDLPDNTFGSRTWNFLFAYSCYIKLVVGHTSIFIEDLRIPALWDDSDQCFQTVTSLEHN